MLRIYEWVCEGDDRRQECGKKVDVLHDDGYWRSDVGSGTLRIVVVMESYLEGGEIRDFKYVGGRTVCRVLLPTLSDLCGETNAQTRLALLCVEGAETPHNFSLISN